MRKRDVIKCDLKERYLPNILYVAHIKNERNDYFPHKHDHLCELMYIVKGEAKVIVEDKKYFVGSGDLVTYNQDVMHSEIYSQKNVVEKYVVGINRVILASLGENCVISYDDKPIIHLKKYAPTVEEYFKTIFKEGSEIQPGYDQICKGLLLSLFAIITRCKTMYSKEEAANEKEFLAFKIKIFIEENFREDLKLKDIASNFYISTYYLSHLFKNEFGVSPIKYVMDLRMGEAQSLLATTNYSISNISTIIGYNNINYFFNLFKRYTGFTPSNFREKCGFCLCTEKR